MRTSQITVRCPSCAKPAVLTFTEFLTGDRAGQHEYFLLCPDKCDLSAADCETLWATGRLEHEPG